MGITENKMETTISGSGLGCRVQGLGQEEGCKVLLNFGLIVCATFCFELREGSFFLLDVVGG